MPFDYIPASPMSISQFVYEKTWPQAKIRKILNQQQTLIYKPNTKNEYVVSKFQICSFTFSYSNENSK